MRQPDFVIECTRFSPHSYGDAPTLGDATLHLTPPGLQFSDVLIVTTRYGLRVVFPRRGVVVNGVLQLDKYGEPLKRRTAIFPELADWIEFTEKAVAAIEKAFPGQMPTRRYDTIEPRDVPAQPTNQPAMRLQNV